MSRTLGRTLLALGVAVAAPTAESAHGAQEQLTLTSITAELGEGNPYTFERGVLRVPQNRANPEGPVVELEFHRFPRLPEADPSVPPIIHLNGGPGWPGFGREIENPRWLDQNVRTRVQFTDWIVVGQRGIGSSAPNTTCQRAAAPRADEPYDRGEQDALALEAARQCRAHWEAEGVDLSGFTVIEAAADVRDVVEALGYEKVQIHGGSYGSHWGMAVMRFYPEIVERALLNGMEGPDHTYDMPGWVLAALERAAADAEASGVYDGRIPDGGLIAGLRRVIERASREPIVVELPQRRDTIEVRMEADDLRSLAGGFTPAQGHRLRAWPADLIRLAEGDFQAAAQAVLRMRFGRGSLGTASYFMLDCGSGISGIRLERLLSDPGADVVGNLGARYEHLCQAWDADLGEDFRQNFDTDIPTVIVHGNWDTSTPLENALELRPYFKDHHFVLVERGTHGALGEALRESEQMREALNRYMATGDRSLFPDVVTLAPLDWVAPDDR